MSSTTPAQPVATTSRPLRLRAHAGPEVRLTPAAAALLTYSVTSRLTVSLFPGDRLTSDLPKLKPGEADHLDESALAPVGTRVEPGVLLVGRLARPPGQASEVEAGIDAAFGVPQGRDGSLRAPPGLYGRVEAVEREEPAKRGAPVQLTVVVSSEYPLQPGDVVSFDGGAPAVVGGVEALLDDDGVWPGAEVSAVLHRHGPAAAEIVHARSIGPYSVVTNQPLGGRAAFGGQEVPIAVSDALLDRDAVHVVHELFTHKSDDVAGRMALYEDLVRGAELRPPSMPQATRTLERLLWAMGFEVDFTEEEVAIQLMTDSTVASLAPGRVVKPETLNYRTLRPERAGLFCTEVFGELGTPERFTWMGHIELAVPLLHPWARRLAATLLGVERKALERVLHGEATLTGEEPEKSADTGSVAIHAALTAVDLENPPAGAEALAEVLRRTRRRPERWCFTRWPVLPAELRPLVPLEGGRFATSDLNDLYRRLINRNNRTRRLLELNAPDIIIRNEVRAMQESLDTLLDNHGRNRVTGPERRPLVSLVDMLVGPRGELQRTRHKRVDYSGVARAAPLASLAERTMRLPRTMALELFKPLLYERLEAAGHVTTLKEAKRLVEGRDAHALEALDALVATRPLIVVSERPGDGAVVLGVDVELWDANAVGLSPRAFSALGLSAGDAVVVHVPLSPAAVEETRRLGFDAPGPRAAVAPGWLGEVGALERPGEFLLQAAVNHEVDPVRDRATRVMLGRLVPPSSPQR